jgi:hypothetical protein
VKEVERNVILIIPLLLQIQKEKRVGLLIVKLDENDSTEGNKGSK